MDAHYDTCDGVDTNAYDEISIMHLGQTICVKGKTPENLNFGNMPTPFVLAVKYECGKPYYSVFQMQNDRFILIGSGDTISTTEDGTIFLRDVKDDETIIYQLVMNEKCWYYKQEVMRF